VDRITRKQLKTDKFAVEVSHTVDYFSEHRSLLIRYGAIGAGVVVVAIALYFYSGHQRVARQEALNQAIRIQEATIGPPKPFDPTFPTLQEKEKAATKAFTDIAGKYSGTDEGAIAHYYLGTIASDGGRLNDAEKELKIVADSGSMYASLAKLSLSQIYATEGKMEQAKTLLRDLIKNPNILVSKEQATLALAKLLAPTDPAEARKLAEPLRTERPAISRAAITFLSNLH
jgi:TolA-binding protein